MFQILMKDSEGRDILLRDQFEESAADLFIQRLSNSGISAVKVEVAPQKVQVVSVVFKLDDTRTYTFQDPDKICSIGDLVEVECSDGRRKTVLVKAAGLRTRQQIQEFCTRNGFPELCKVIRLIWRPDAKKSA